MVKKAEVQRAVVQRVRRGRMALLLLGERIFHLPQRCLRLLAPQRFGCRPPRAPFCCLLQGRQLQRQGRLHLHARATLVLACLARRFRLPQCRRRLPLHLRRLPPHLRRRRLTPLLVVGKGGSR